MENDVGDSQAIPSSANVERFLNFTEALIPYPQLFYSCARHLTRYIYLEVYMCQIADWSN